jgi:predicted anti-sigma-YlaC factor YlaD
MKKIPGRHFTEEELLMHFLREETEEISREIHEHLEHCSECSAVRAEYGEIVDRVRSWTVPEIPEDAWKAQKHLVMAHFRQDLAAGKSRSILERLKSHFATGWNYALENPLPTLTYIAVGTAFALERTITTFSLDRVLPGASQVFELLRQVF